MREKELRLAVVLTGGISLAVYMHGVTKELLKLTRASARYHGEAEFEDRQALDADCFTPEDKKLFDTEPVYLNALKALGPELELRVIIDTLAGASAGGMNATYLARALAHDLPFEHLRGLWLEGADIQELMPEARQKSLWTSWLGRQIVRWTLPNEWHGLTVDRESTSRILNLMDLVSRKPPFDGEKLSRSLLGGFESMGEAQPGQSLMPHGLELNCFITTTDFYGLALEVKLGDPPGIREMEHRNILRFSYLRDPSETEESHFGLRDAPALTFAARATSSFPGAFPPAQLGEIDRVLAARGEAWGLAKEDFLVRNFPDYLALEQDPNLTSFIDGSVLNDKPLGVTLSAISDQPAYRKVDRRLLFINPTPRPTPPPPNGAPPSLLATLRGALSDIPRNEPIRDDIARFHDFNREAERVRALIDASRPEIAGQVADILGRAASKRPSSKQVESWRDKANERAMQGAGFGWPAYVGAKLEGAISFAAALINGVVDKGWMIVSPEADTTKARLRAWAEAREIVPIPGTPPQGARWVQFLRQFDLPFRERRLHATIRGLNRLYERINEPPLTGLSAYRLDYIKTGLYEALSRVSERRAGAKLSTDATHRIQALFADDPASASDEAIDELMEALARDLDLEAVNSRADALLAAMESEGAGGAARAELLIDYLGFAFWDVIHFATGQPDMAQEIQPIKLMRICPEDTEALGPFGQHLRGAALGNFGAFFKRAYREHDYLFGRLQSAERIVDLLVDAAGQEDAAHLLDSTALKRDLFLAILNTEEAQLPEMGKIIRQLRAYIRENL